MLKKSLILSNKAPTPNVPGAAITGVSLVNRSTVDTTTIKEDELGYLLLWVNLARIGEMTFGKDELFPEGVPDGITPHDEYQVSIEEEELDQYRVQNSFSLKPFTLDHPETVVVTAEAFLQVAVGVVGETRFDGSHLSAPLSVFNQEAKDAISTGAALEVSTGFVADLFLDEDDRLYFRNIAGNHLALVSHGRCGKSCSIQYSINNSPKLKKEQQMKVTLSEGVTIDIDDSSAALVNTTLAAKDAELSNAATAKDATISGLEAKVAALKANQFDEAKVAELVAARNAVLKKIPADAEIADVDSKSVMELALIAIANAYPEMDMKDKSIDVVQAVVGTIDDQSQKEDGSSFFVATKNKKGKTNSDAGDDTHEQHLWNMAYGKKENS